MFDGVEETVTVSLCTSTNPISFSSLYISCSLMSGLEMYFNFISFPFRFVFQGFDCSLIGDFRGRRYWYWHLRCHWYQKICSCNSNNRPLYSPSAVRHSFLFFRPIIQKTTYIWKTADTGTSGIPLLHFQAHKTAVQWYTVRKRTKMKRGKAQEKRFFGNLPTLLSSSRSGWNVSL